MESVCGVSAYTDGVERGREGRFLWGKCCKGAEARDASRERKREGETLRKLEGEMWRIDHEFEIADRVPVVPVRALLDRG